MSRNSLGKAVSNVIETTHLHSEKVKASLDVCEWIAVLKDYLEMFSPSFVSENV